MSMEKRTFTKEQKLEILKEAAAHGVTVTLEKYGIYPATYYSWHKKFDTMGEAGFRHGMDKEKYNDPAPEGQKINNHG